MSAYHVFSLSLVRYLIPVFLFGVPYFMQGTINFRFSVKDAAAGIAASLVILVPFSLFALSTGRVFTMMPFQGALFQFAGVAFPEEAYFRGFLQERLGNSVRAVFAASLLFALVHVLQFVVYRDPYALLTFFPSLVMGFLYLRTSNILPSVVFHFLSNVVFLGFYDIL